jgi:hypothetical protein
MRVEVVDVKANQVEAKNDGAYSSWDRAHPQPPDMFSLL